MVKKQTSTNRRVRTGVALSMTELCAADMRLPKSSGSTWRTPLDPPEPNGGGWPSLAAALRTLAETLGIDGGRLVVALMPPLTEVRRLDLPPLKREQVTQLLSRNAHRYFVTAREPQVIGTSFTRRARTGNSPVLGAAAPARLVNAIGNAAREAGWTLEGIVPAEVGWAAAATSLWPSFGRDAANVLVHHEDRTDLLTMNSGELAGVRRFRPGAIDAELIVSALNETRSNGTAPRVGSFGAYGPRQELARSLPSSAAIVSSPPAEWNNPNADAMSIAATFATADEGLALRTEDIAELRAAQGRRATMGIVAVTVALLIGAAMLELWGVKRELAAVQAERARIHPQLENTLVGRSNFELSNRKLSALFAAHRESPYLSGVIAAVTDALPEGSHLLSFRARRDTLVVDGLATSSALAFSGLEAAPELANVRAISGIQRQLQDDGTAFEHFTVQALMALPIPPSSPPVKRRTP